MSLALWGEVGPLGLGEGELACGIVWPCMCGATKKSHLFRGGIFDIGFQVFITCHSLVIVAAITW